MLYQAQVTVRLKRPLELVEHGKPHENKATAYLIFIWVNAECFSEAAQLVEEVALNPKDAEGKRTSYQGYVEEAEIQVIEPNQMPDEIRAAAGNLDRQGVLAATTLTFFEREP